MGQFALIPMALGVVALPYWLAQYAPPPASYLLKGITGYFLLIHIGPWLYYQVTAPRYSS